jgi:hypothetical protein
MQPFCVTPLDSRLWKRYLAALGNPSKLPKTICNRFRQPLMEWYVTAGLVTYPVMQPLMEMVCNHSVYSLSTVCLALAYTIYGSGR